MSRSEDDDAIAKYSAELQAEAELARADLDEIEDHLRSLASELRDRGMPRSEAIAEACRRIGEPKQVAREHARVRSPFAAKLSRARAWSAAALLLVPIVGYASQVLPYTGPWSYAGAEIGFGTMLALALVARLSWARPIALGGIAFFTILTTVVLVDQPAASLVWLLPYLGMLAFLAPWRRGEIRTGGYALAFQTWTFGAAVVGLGFEISTADGARYLSHGSQIAFVAALVAMAGGIVRARWGAIASMVSAATLGFAMLEISGLTIRLTNAGPFLVTFMALLTTGCLAAVIASVLAWRTARSTFGTLRSVLS